MAPSGATRVHAHDGAVESLIEDLREGEKKSAEGNAEEKDAVLGAQQKKADSALAKTLDNELEWVRSNPKARQSKG